MVRIFKYREDDPEYGIRCIAGEMLNLEYGRRMWRCDKFIKGQHKTYPIVKLDTCKVVPTLIEGYLYMPTYYYDIIASKIESIIEEMELMVPYKKVVKVFHNNSAYCSIESTTTITRSIQPENDGCISNFASNFIWYVCDFPIGFSAKHINPISYMSTIVLDRDNICKWSNDAKFYRGITLDDIRIPFCDAPSEYQIPGNLPLSLTYIPCQNQPLNVLKRICISNIAFVHSLHATNFECACPREGIDRMTRESRPYTNSSFTNKMTVVEIKWEDVKKLDIFSPLAIEPSIDTRGGSDCDIDNLYASEGALIQNIPRYDDNIRYNVCCCCGLQLYDDIYIVQLKTYPCDLLNRCKVGDNKITKIRIYFDRYVSKYVLVCVGCLSYKNNHKHYGNVHGVIFRAKHPCTFEDFIKPLSNRLGSFTKLLYAIHNSNEIVVRESNILVISCKKKTYVYAVANRATLCSMYSDLMELSNKKVYFRYTPEIMFSFP